MYSIRLETKVNADSTVIYKALTQQDHLQKWFAPQVIIAPVINTFGAFAFEFDLSFRIQIKELAENEKVVWEIIEGIDGWESTLISFSIQKFENYSLVIFEHSLLEDQTKKEKWQNSWNDFLIKLSQYCR